MTLTVTSTHPTLKSLVRDGITTEVVNDVGIEAVLCKVIRQKLRRGLICSQQLIYRKDGTKSTTDFVVNQIQTENIGQQEEGLGLVSFHARWRQSNVDVGRSVLAGLNYETRPGDISRRALEEWTCQDAVRLTSPVGVPSQVAPEIQAAQRDIVFKLSKLVFDGVSLRLLMMLEENVDDPPSPLDVLHFGVTLYAQALAKRRQDNRRWRLTSASAADPSFRAPLLLFGRRQV